MTSNSADRPGRAVSGARSGRGGRHARRAAGWLAVDAARAVHFEPGRRRGPPTALAGDLRDGLGRWRRRVARRHALVVARRLLLVAVAVAVVLEAALALAGADRRTPWLAAPLALAATAVAVLLARRVTLEQTARMLDSGLGLRDRVGTALELTAAPPPAAGLAAIVSGEATAAVAASFGAARLATPRARAESAALIAAALALALLVVLPGGTGPSGAASAAASRLAAARGATTHPGSRRHAARPSSPASSPTAPRTPIARRDQPRVHFGHGVGAQQLHRQGLAVPRIPVADGRRHAVGPQQLRAAVHRSRSTHADRALPGVFEAVPANGGAPAPGVAVGTEVKGGQVGLSPTAAAVGPASGSGHHGAAPARKGGAQAGARGGARSNGGSPGGDGAGGQPGSDRLGPALVPDLPHGRAGLPVEAGYAPGITGQGRNEGISQIPNGGAGNGRTARANVAGALHGPHFTVLPPFSSAAPAVDAPQLNDYFGVADQLGLGAW